MKDRLGRLGAATAGCAALLGGALAPASALADFPSRAQVARSETTGKVRFVGLPAGRPAAAPSGFDRSSAAASVGREQLTRNASALGLTGSTVRTVGSERAARGIQAVRYQQYVGGVPVLGGQFVVQLDRYNRMLSLNGEALPAAGVDVTPGIDAATADRAAISHVARGERIHAALLDAESGGLAIFDPRIMGGPGARRPALVYRTTVESQDGLTKKLVLIDARRGVEVATIDEIHEAKNRSVCDAANTSAQLPCTSPVLTEGGTYSGPGAADVQPAYDYAGATYDFFFSRFGRDSLDGAGFPLKSTVRYCAPGAPCPFQNAFWNGEQMAYGQGFAVADDVVGHELTHGVTDFTSSLFYYYQSGAINESLSDVFGELIDQVTPSPDDTAGDRWLMGESLSIGEIRDMENPPAFGDPDRMGSPNYTLDPDELDAGGVHSNSGVNNKAAFLMTDGGTFNTQTITPLGLTKTAAIYYLVETGFLTSASDYRDLGTVLVQACQNLQATGVTTAGDCDEVGQVVAATEMLTNEQGAVDVAACTIPGESPFYSFFDDLEDTGSGRWASRAISGANGWYYPGSNSPYGDLTYAHSGTANFFGDDFGGTLNPDAPGPPSDFVMELQQNIAIPPNSSLRFHHSHGFEDFGVNNFDGGIVEISTNGGTTWQTLGSLGSPYNGTIVAGQGNPLGGRVAFVNESHGYEAVEVSLGAFAGQTTVRLRFRIGVDAYVGDYGWHIDDIGVHTCGTEPPPDVDLTAPDTVITSGPAEGSTTTDPTPAFAFGSNESDVTFQCRVDGAVFAVCPAALDLPTLANGVHRLDVRAVDAAGNIDDTPATRSFRVAAPSTTTPPPGGVIPPGTAPTFRLVGRPRVKGTSVTFTVDVPAAGRLSAAGKARVKRGGRTRTVKTGTKSSTVRAAGRVRITVKLNRATVALLRRSKLKVTYTVKFQPTVGKAVSKTASVTFKRRR